MQGYFGSGILTENSASADNNYLKRLESKKLLSSVEKAGLLSKAEKAGLTLSKVSPGISASCDSVHDTCPLIMQPRHVVAAACHCHNP